MWGYLDVGVFVRRCVRAYKVSCCVDFKNFETLALI